jgi:hypothetical protein
MGERIPPQVDQPKTETFEEALNRLNKNGAFSPDEMRRAIKLQKTIEELERSQRIPPDLWDKVFSLARETGQTQQAVETEREPEWTRTGIHTPHKTIIINPEDKIDTDKLQKDTPRVFAKMRALEKQCEETARVSDETRRTRINT